MYELWRSIFDDVLMGPQLAPYTVSFLVVVITMAVINVLSGGDGEAEADEDGD